MTELTRREDCLHGEFLDGEVTFGVYFSTQTEEDEAFLVALHKWVNTDEDVSLNFRFSVRDCIDDLIDGYSYRSEAKVIFDREDKPMVDALRAELLEQVARLDAIEFKD